MVADDATKEPRRSRHQNAFRLQRNDQINLCTSRGGPFQLGTIG